MATGSEPDDPKSSLLEAILSGIDVSRKLGDTAQRFPRPIDLLITMVTEKLSVAGEFKIYFHPRV